MTAAGRQRRWRQRQAAGVQVIPVPVDQVTIDSLVARLLLRKDGDRDPASIAQALLEAAKRSEIYRYALRPRGLHRETVLARAQRCNFLNIRVWTTADGDTRWPTQGTGKIVRMGELADFADGLAKALEMTEDDEGEQH